MPRPSPGVTRLATAAVLGLCLAVAARAQDGPSEVVGNLLANGDFETLDAQGGPANWSTQDWGDNSLAAAKIIGGGHAGGRCLQLRSEIVPVFFGLFAQPATVGPKPPERLLLSFWYRTLGNPQADVTVHTFGENFAVAEWKTPVLAAETEPVDNSSGWRCHTWELQCLPSAQQVIVTLRIHGDGALLVDGIALRPLPSEVSCEVLEAGLVTGLNGARSCKLKLTSRSGEALPLRVSLEAGGAPQAPRASAEARLTLPARGQQTVALPYGYPLSTPHSLQLTVAAPKPGAVYDVLSLSIPGLVAGRLISPAFRCSFVPTVPGDEVEVAGRLNATPEIAAKLKLEAVLLGPKTDRADVQPEPSGDFRVRMAGAELLSGNYGVQIRALQDRKEIARLDLPLSKLSPSNPQAGFDAARRWYPGGRAVFPLGIYYALESADLKDAAEAGFNCVVAPSRTTNLGRLDELQALGLTALVSSPSMETTFWANTTGKYQARPELGGWYPLQRPDNASPPALPELMDDLYCRLRALDPVRPVCLALSSPSRMAAYLSACDVVMPWTKPSPPGDLRSVDMMIRRALELADGIKPVWPVLQLAGAAYTEDNRLDPQASGRPPTPAEFRCMAFLALARGANGLFCYALTSPSSRTQRVWDVRQDAPPLWDMVRKVGLQTKALSPALLDGEPLKVEVSPDQPAVVVRGLRYQEYAYIIAVNPTAEAQPLAFTVPGLAARELELGFDAAKLTAAAAGAFSDTLEPHGVRVYVAKWE